MTHLAYLKKGENMLPDISKDFLFNNLPVIFHDGEYIIYSPFEKKLVKVKNFNKKFLQEHLSVKFFGTPKKRELKLKYGHLSIITTTDCNLRCEYCFANGGEKPIYIDEEISFKAIDELTRKDIDDLEVTFFGGEPTMNMGIVKKVVEYCKNKNVKAHFDITTNGVINTEKANFLLDNKFNVTISVDGPPVIQSKIRKSVSGNDVTKVIENTMSILAKAPERLKARVTITNTNISYMPEIVKYAARFGIKYIHFAAVNITGRAKSATDMQPSAHSYASGFIESMSMAKKLGVSVTDEGLIYLLQPATSFCSSTAKTKLIVTPDDSISTCLEIQSCDAENNLFIIGKYNRLTKEFEYNDDKINNLKCLDVDKIKECEICPWKYICSSGCPIRNIVKTNDIYKPNDYYCTIKKYILHEVVSRMSIR